jgi:hypothetical protein
MNLRFMIYDLLFFLFLLAGCSQPQPTQRPPVAEPTKTTEQNVAQPAEDTAKLAPPAAGPAFAPVKIGILPLTELSSPSDASQGGKLSVFVTLLDTFGSQMKAPGVLRFELYEYIPRSAQSKGQRLTLWPDVDLTGPAQNNKYWRDFLRAYEFVLDTQASRDKTYILEVTCMCPDGRRLSGEYILKSSP